MKRLTTFSRICEFLCIALASILIGDSFVPSIGLAVFILLYAVTEIKHILEDKK